MQKRKRSEKDTSLFSYVETALNDQWFETVEELEEYIKAQAADSGMEFDQGKANKAVKHLERLISTKAAERIAGAAVEQLQADIQKYRKKMWIKYMEFVADSDTDTTDD